MNSLTIFLIFLGVTIIILLISYLISRSKGKIAIELEKYEFNLGEKVKGTIILTIKKPLEAKSINIGIEAISKQTDYSQNTIKQNDDKVFEFSKPLKNNLSLSPGESKYPFEVLIPSDHVSQPQNQIIRDITNSLKALSGNFGGLEWYVKASLDIPGMNLSKKIRINVG